MPRSLSLGMVALVALHLAGCNSYRIAVPFTSNDENDNQYYTQTVRRLPDGNREYVTPQSFLAPMAAPDRAATPAVVTVPPPPAFSQDAARAAEPVVSSLKKEAVGSTPTEASSQEKAADKKVLRTPNKPLPQKLLKPASTGDRISALDSDPDLAILHQGLMSSAPLPHPKPEIASGQ